MIFKKKNIKNKNEYQINLEFLKEKKFDFVNELKKEIPQSEIFLVGGAVRDTLLHRRVNDYDFIVRKVDANNLGKFLSKLGKVELVGKRFGVFKFWPKNESHNNPPIEIALPRREHAFGTGGYRDVEVQSDPNLSVKEDLSRRDFTINAIALKINNLGKLEIIDPFNGQSDLKRKLIKAVRNPEKRFKEDYSRILRGIRFACQLNNFFVKDESTAGWKIEEKTWEAIKKNMQFINKINRRLELIKNGLKDEPEIVENRIVPYEVIAKELLKSFYFNPVLAFDLYDESGAFKELIPELLKMKNCPQPKNFHSEGDVWTHTRLALEKLSSSKFKKQFGSKHPSEQLILATLFHDIGKPYTIKTPEKDGTDRIRFNKHDTVGAEIAKKICQRLRFSTPQNLGVDSEKISWLVGHHMLLVQGDISKMRSNTIEKYFFNPKNPGEDLLKLSFVDISATIPEVGQPNFDDFYQMINRIDEIKKLGANKKELPKPILNGNDVIKKFNFKPGPKIGKLLHLLREQQLNGKIKTKEKAIKFLKDYLKR